LLKKEKIHLSLSFYLYEDRVFISMKIVSIERYLTI